MITGSSLGHRQALFFGTCVWKNTHTGAPCRGGQAAALGPTTGRVTAAFTAAFAAAFAAAFTAAFAAAFTASAEALQRYGASAALFAAISAS
jgi:hypothetical protein